jgi:2-C-methyl-D-erythritol 4-phosphate cytidylyltransferase
MSIDTQYDALILVAGTGRRMQSNQNKIFLKINGKPVFEYSLDLFKEDLDCQRIILVGKKEEESHFSPYLSERVKFVQGGLERQDSVRLGLKQVISPQVMIHDGARPFLTKEKLEDLKNHPNSILAIPVKDTIKEVKEDNTKIEKTLDRSHLYAAQTPQYFSSKLITTAHADAYEDNYMGTDDASLVEKYSSQSVELVEGSYENIKVTTPDDLLMGELLAKKLFGRK